MLRICSPSISKYDLISITREKEENQIKQNNNKHTKTDMKS